MSFCPECEAVIEEEFEEIGEIFTCPECGLELEVMSLDPPEFDLAPLDEEEEEDDDDDYDFDESDDEEDWEEDEEEDEDEEDEES